MVSNPQGAWKTYISSKTETGPKTSKYRKIKNRAIGKLIDGRIESWTECQSESNATLYFSLCVVGFQRKTHYELAHL